MEATLSMTGSLPQAKEAAPHLETLLVVDDEDAIRETVALALEEQGYQVLQAADGRQALEMVHTVERLDLMILDLMLPSLNGLDLCRLLRREGNTIPILMLTAKSSETDRVVGLELGADDYLTKPFGMRELIARCRSVLRRQQLAQASDATVLRYGDLCMFTQECRVLVRGVEVSFSPKEFRLLELFMSNPAAFGRGNSSWSASGDPTSWATARRWMSISAGCGKSWSWIPATQSIW